MAVEGIAPGGEAADSFFVLLLQKMLLFYNMGLFLQSEIFVRMAAFPLNPVPATLPFERRLAGERLSGLRWGKG